MNAMTKRTPINNTARVACILAAVFSVVQTANAADGTWTGASDANWATEGNWTGGVPGTGETATFNGPSANTTVSLGAGVTVSNMLFDTSAAAAYTIGSGGVGSETNTLDHGGSITVNADVANPQTFNAAVTLGADRDTGTYAIQNNSAQTLTLAGDITGSTLGGTAGNKTIFSGGDGDISINGTIGKGGASNFFLTKSGVGTLHVNGSATFTGNAGSTVLDFSGGVIDLGTAGQLTITGSGSPAPTGISGSGTIKGGTLSVDKSMRSTGALIIDSPLTSYGGGFSGGGTLVLANPNNSFSQNLTISGNSTLAFTDLGSLGNSQGIGFGGSISAGTLKYIGGTGGTLMHSFIFSYATTHTIDQSGSGLLVITNSFGVGSLAVILQGSTSGSGRVESAISGSGGITKSGTGAWTLSGNNSYTGRTRLNAGTLNLDYTANNTSKLSDTATLVGGYADKYNTGLNLVGGILEMVGGTHTEVVPYTVISGGTTLIVRNSGSSILNMGLITTTSQANSTTSGSATMTVEDTTNLGVGMAVSGSGLPTGCYIGSIVDGTTVTLVSNNGASRAATSTTTGTVTLHADPSGAIDFSSTGIAKTPSVNNTAGILSLLATLSGTDYAMNDGADNITAYASYTPFSGTLAADTIYSLTGSLSLSSSPSQASSGLKIAPTSSGHSLVLGNNNLTVGSILFTGSHDYAITASSDKYASASILNYGTGILTVAGGYACNYYGTGKSIITGIAGSHQARGIYGGTVQFSDRLQIAPDIAGASTTTLNNGTLLADTTSADIAFARGDGTSTRSFSIGEGGGTFDVIGGNDFTIPGVISGAGPLFLGSESTSGRIVLTGNSSYSGTATVRGGTLMATNRIAGTVSVATNATLSIGTPTAPGTFNVSSVSFDTGSTLVVRVDGDQPGEYSVLELASGGSTIGSDVTLVVDDRALAGTNVSIPIMTMPGSGALNGQFTNVSGIRTNWDILYSRTNVVLTMGPPSGTVLIVR